MKRTEQRNHIDIPNAAVLAANAVSALQLALKGMGGIIKDREPMEAELEALEWLAQFAADATEATMALTNDLPPRWRLFSDEHAAASACAEIPPLHASPGDTAP